MIVLYFYLQFFCWIVFKQLYLYLYFIFFILHHKMMQSIHNKTYTKQNKKRLRKIHNTYYLQCFIGQLFLYCSAWLKNSIYSIILQIYKNYSGVYCRCMMIQGKTSFSVIHYIYFKLQYITVHVVTIHLSLFINILYNNSYK